MDLRKLLLDDFGTDLPISGGTGNSRDNPIVVHREDPNDYVGVERYVLQCIARGRGLNIEFKQQALILHNGRSIDQLKVELSKDLGDRSEHTIENYYFDVTECIGIDMPSPTILNERSQKIVQLWRIAHKSGKVPIGQLAGAVYFGVTDKPPPREVEGIDSAMGLIEYFKKLETGTSFTQAERKALGQEIIRMSLERPAPNLGAMRFLTWIPNIALILAVVALMAPPFSWVILAITAFGLLHNGFAKYLAGKGHQSAGLHIGIALVAIASSIALSILHILSSYQFI